MSKTLVTKLNGKVDNQQIAKLGYFPFRFKIKDTNKNVYFEIDTVSRIGVKTAYLPEDGSYFTDREGNQNLGTETISTGITHEIVYLSKNASLIFINKYDITGLEFKDNYTYDAVSLDVLKYCSNLSTISGYFVGSFNSFSSDLINKLKEVRFDDGSSIEDFDIGIFQNGAIERLHVSNSNITGDLSNTPACLAELLTRKHGKVLEYNGNRPSNSKLLALYGGVNLGDNVDAFLIDNARFVANSNNYNYTWKSIEIRGTRTSASDAAIQTLQSNGFTVSINPA